MFAIGSLRIYVINDGDTKVDPGGAFGLVPRALWSRYQPEDDDRLIPMRNHCLYVESGGRKILIDTGIGTKGDPKQLAMWKLERPRGHLLEALARLDVQPEDIDLVIDTHLHYDHCSGNTRLDADGLIVPTFPNAEYVVQRREYEDAMQPNERTAATYFPVNYEPLVQSGQMRLLDGDTELAPGIRGVVTRGHTPAHMSVVLEDGGESALYTCDMATYAVHFERLGWMTAYDVEPLHTMESKRRWQQWAIQHNALVIFPHDAVRSAGRLTQAAGGKPVLEQVAVEYV